MRVVRCVCIRMCVCVLHSPGAAVRVCLGVCEYVHALPSPVAGVVGAGVVRAHHHEHVLEVGADVFGREGQRPGLLEHDGDDVVPNVAQIGRAHV